MGAFGGWPSSLRNCLPPFVGVNVVRPRRAWSADAALAGLRALHIDASSLRQDGSYRGKPGSGQAAPGGPTGLLCCGVVQRGCPSDRWPSLLRREHRARSPSPAPRDPAGRQRRRGLPLDIHERPVPGPRQPDRHSGDPDIEKTSQATDLGIAPAQQITGSAPRPSGQDHERPPSPDTGRGHPETSVRNDTVTIATTVCAQCGASFTPVGRRSWRGWVWSGCCPAAAPGGFAGRRRSTIGR